jgi:hypothetical protein
MNQKFIVIDGKTYHSIDEMPPDIRQKYEQAMRSLGDANDNRVPDTFETVPFETVNIFADQNNDGVPDMLENIVAGNSVVNSVKIFVDGKKFDGLENLPPEHRARYDEAMRKLDANRNGIPDFVEGMTNASNQTANIATSFGTETPLRSSAPLSASPTITPDTSSGWGLALAGLFLILLCGVSAAGIWYFFLR